MRIKIIVSAALLALEFFHPTLASPTTQLGSPANEWKASPIIEHRQPPVGPPTPTRGQLLYENHCMSCHESLIHIRTRQQAKSLTELRERVSYWAEYLQLSWGKEDVEVVVTHLDNQYYKFESR